MPTALVTAVGQVKPAFPQMLSGQMSRPAAIGQGRAVGQTLQEKTGGNIQGTVRIYSQVTENIISPGIGDKPIGPVPPEIDRLTLEFQACPEIRLK